MRTRLSGWWWHVRAFYRTGDERHVELAFCALLGHAWENDNLRDVERCRHCGTEISRMWLFARFDFGLTRHTSHVVIRNVT